jgi:hypothetical protein
MPIAALILLIACMVLCTVLWRWTMPQSSTRKPLAAPPTYEPLQWRGEPEVLGSCSICLGSGMVMDLADSLTAEAHPCGCSAGWKRKVDLYAAETRQTVRQVSIAIPADQRPFKHTCAYGVCSEALGPSGFCSYHAALLASWVKITESPGPQGRLPGLI